MAKFVGIEFSIGLINSETNTLILPACYFAPISYWALALKFNEVIIDPFEFNLKQSYRSRCSIYSVNGKQNLSVVTNNSGSKTPINQSTLVDYEPWRKIHIKALESAYSASPFFEFFADEVFDIIQNQSNGSLYDLNMSTINWVNNTLDLNLEFKVSTEFVKAYDASIDMRPGKRNEFLPPHPFQEYNQVFMDKGKGFIPNLSILDLIFNLGIEARLYLKKLTKYEC